MNDRDLRPVGRYEWESVIMRARLGGVVGGSGKRGGVSGTTFTAVALVLASHADGVTGGDVFPGDATLAVLAETSLKTVKAVKAALIRLGLIELVRAGARRYRGGNEYRLTLPGDLHDILEVLSSADVKGAAARVSEADRRPQRGSRGPLTTHAVQGPEDPTQDAVRVPEDPSQAGDPEGCTGSSGPADPGYSGSSGPVVQGPEDRYTNQDHPERSTNQANQDRTPPTYGEDPDALPEPLRTIRLSLMTTDPGSTLDDARAVGRLVAERHHPKGTRYYTRIAEGGGFSAYLTEHRAAAAEARRRDLEEQLRTAPPCDHGQPGGQTIRTPDGQPSCALCRRGMPAGLATVGTDPARAEMVTAYREVALAAGLNPDAHELITITQLAGLALRTGEPTGEAA